MGQYLRRSMVLATAGSTLLLSLVGLAGAATRPVSPTPPRTVHAIPGSASAVVRWTKAARGTQTSYTVVSFPASRGCTTRALSCSVPGLANATSYRFRVRASNQAGASPWSAWSAMVAPRAVATGVLSVNALPESSLTQPTVMISDGTDLWVANNFNGIGSITKVSLATHRASVIRSPLLNNPMDLASNGVDLFITGANSPAQLSGYVLEMNIATGVFHEIDSSTFVAPSGIAATANYAYTANVGGGANSTGSLSRIDLTTGAVTEIDSPLFNQPGAVVLAGGYLWVANASGGPNNTGSLLEMDLASAQITEVDSASFNNSTALAGDQTQVAVLNTPSTTTITGTALAPHASVSVLTIASGAIATAPLATASGVAMDANNIWVTTTAGGTYGDGSLVDLSPSATTRTVVDSSLFVNPNLVAAAAGQAYVISSESFNGTFGGSSPGQLVEINPNGFGTHYGPGLLPPQNPSANLVTNPQYNGGVCTYSSYYVYTVTVACTSAMLQAINNAHLAENVKPMVLPTNWNSLTVPEQIYVVITLERVDRGLPPYLGINAALNVNAQGAAVLGQDPSLAKGFPDASYALGGVWAGGYAPLSADFGWMYSDGWGGSLMTMSNGTCPSAHAPGCWGHRDELLGADPGYNPGVGLGCTTCEIGVGYSFLAKYRLGSYVSLIERPTSTPPPMVFTWAHDVVPFLPVQ